MTPMRDLQKAIIDRLDERAKELEGNNALIREDLKFYRENAVQIRLLKEIRQEIPGIFKKVMGDDE